MNGLSLLVVLAAVGVDVGWESTSTGKLAYTIRIESISIETLADGLQSVQCVVDKSDRGLRKFRVAVGPKNLQAERVAAVTANEVDYGWEPSPTGGINYYVQISRERLETLARGYPLECDVHPDVPEIENIYVFVGDVPLPRESPKGVRSSTPAPPRDLGTIDNSRGGSVAPVSGTETSIGAPRYGNSGYGTSVNTQGNASDANRNNSYAAQPPQGNAAGNQPYGPQAPNGQFSDNTLPVPPLDTNRSADYDRNRDLNYDYNRNQYPPQQTLPNYTQTAALPNQQPPYHPQHGPAPGYGNPAPTYATGSTANPATDALAATLAFTQAQLEKAQLEKDRLALANTNAEPKLPVEEPKSSKPLILTTLALFASIGANAYLGWLAWSFFWRFRDAASDLSRARSNAFPGSSLAGH